MNTRLFIQLFSVLMVVCDQANGECEMPCEWRGRNFTLYGRKLDGNVATFTSNGGFIDLTGTTFGMINFTCLETYGKHLVISYVWNNISVIQCMAVEYTLEDPVRFKFGLQGYLKPVEVETPPIGIDEFCDLCRGHFHYIYVAQDPAIEEIPPTDPLTCDAPYTCTPLGSTSIACTELEEIPLECNPKTTTTTSFPETTTTPFPETTTTDKTGPRSCITEHYYYNSKRYLPRMFRKRQKKRRYNYGYYSRQRN